MSLAFDSLTGADISPVLSDVAALRLEVFRDWPYLYEGDMEYERRYLAAYASSPGAVIVAARADTGIVGAATGTPMEDHAADFGAAFANTGLALEDIFYCAESVLLADWRGKGAGHRFFDLREAHARALGRRHVAFCSVMRPDDHPARPKGYRPLDDFWRARGYAPLPGIVAHFSWRDMGEEQESAKPLQLWIREI